MKNTLTFRRRRKGIVRSHAGAIFRHAARLPCHAEKKAGSMNAQDSRPAYERKIYSTFIYSFYATGIVSSVLL